MSSTEPRVEQTGLRRTFSDRRAGRDPERFTDVPPHLDSLLRTWLSLVCPRSTNDCQAWFMRLALLCRQRFPEVSTSHYADETPRDLLMDHWDLLGDDAKLDLLDAILEDGAGRRINEDVTNALRNILDRAGAAYTVTPDGRGLMDIVDPQTVLLAQEAMRPDDRASAHLAEAWAKAYGRDPDGPDAWDHAIQAVEAVLLPLVIPTDTSATLGRALRQLRTNTDRFRFVLDGTQTNDRGTPRDVTTLVTVLEMIWAQPERHPGAGSPATTGQARVVVSLATAVVQWLREGALSPVE